MEHARLVEALRNPGIYPHPVTRVDYVQTHVSSLFLTGERAYKLKKPVDFGFLDFSTVELRRRNCEAEVRLNRRLAPSVYLGVARITQEGDRLALDGPGEVVDWLVAMRQLEGRLLGPEVLERGDLGEHHIDALVAQLVPFYEAAATGPGVDEYGTADGFKVTTDENFDQTAAFVGRAISARQYEEIRDFTNGFFSDQIELLKRRVAEGRIRECHGDLHLGNIFFEDPPVIFDCIEFNPRISCTDVAVDLAFLAMDLKFRGVPELGQRLVDRYVEQSGDEELPGLMDFYRCYRAYVRGKIACFTSVDPGLDERGREQQLSLARSYFELAHRYAEGTGSDV